MKAYLIRHAKTIDAGERLSQRSEAEIDEPTVSKDLFSGLKSQEKLLKKR